MAAIERIQGPQDDRIDVSHGPSHGLAFALPWAIVLWLAIACAVMVLA